MRLYDYLRRGIHPKLWNYAEVADEFTGIKLRSYWLTSRFWVLWSATYNFFVIVDLVVKLKASGCALVSCSRHKPSQRRAK